MARLDFELAPLRLARPFRVAHGASRERTVVRVCLDGAAWGEGPFVPYYPHRPEESMAWLEALKIDAILEGDPLALDAQLDRLPPGPAPAMMALDLALHDRWGQHLGQPLHRAWGLRSSPLPISAMTLSIGTYVEDVADEMRLKRGCALYKVKVGSGNRKLDEASIRLVHDEAEGAAVAVDANGGWSCEDAVFLLPRLADLNLAYIEQPVAVGTDGSARHESWRTLRAMLAQAAPGVQLPPLIADESVQSLEDIEALAGLADGVNIKLLKSHGLRGARRWIARARELEMRVMVGCMIESAIGCTAAAQLAPWADFLDVDGFTGVVNNQHEGITYDRGQVRLPLGPGLGLTPISHDEAPGTSGLS